MRAFARGLKGAYRIILSSVMTVGISATLVQIVFVDYVGAQSTVGGGSSLTTSVLGQPMQLAPEDNSATNDPSFSNAWEAVDGAVAYEYEATYSLGGVTQTYIDTSNAGNYDLTGPTIIRYNTSLADATYAWKVRGIDMFGTPGQWSVTQYVTVDTISPLISVDSVMTDVSTPAVTGTIDDPSAFVEVIVDSVVYAPLITGTTWVVEMSGGLPDGLYDVVAIATDLAGNVAIDETDGELVIDTTKPHVEITNPTAAYLSGSGILVRGTMSDEYLDTHELTITNASSTVIYSQPGGSDASAQYVWNTTAIPDGQYTVTLRATDAVGNTASVSQLFTVDNNGPMRPGAPLTTPNPTRSQNIRWTWTGADDGGGAGVGAYEYNLNNGGWVSTPNTATTIDTNGLTEGLHTLAIRAIDNSGNTGQESDTTTVIIDLTAPLVVLVADDATVGNGRLVRVYATISDTYSYTYSLKRDGIDVTLPVDFLTAGYAFVTKGLASGLYVFELIAIDEAGNAGTETITVAVDNTPPLIQYNGYDQNGRVVTPRISITGYSALRWTASPTNPPGASFDPTLQSPSFTFSFSGFYSYTVTAVDEYGNTARASIVLYYRVPPVSLPTILPAVTADKGPDNQQATGEIGVDGVSTKADVSVAGAQSDSDTWAPFGIVWYWFVAIAGGLVGIAFMIIVLVRRQQQR